MNPVAFLLICMVSTGEAAIFRRKKEVKEGDSHFEGVKFKMGSDTESDDEDVGLEPFLNASGQFDLAPKAERKPSFSFGFTRDSRPNSPARSTSSGSSGSFGSLASNVPRVFKGSSSDAKRAMSPSDATAFKYYRQFLEHATTDWTELNAGQEQQVINILDVLWRKGFPLQTALIYIATGFVAYTPSPIAGTDSFVTTFLNHLKFGSQAIALEDVVGVKHSPEYFLRKIAKKAIADFRTRFPLDDMEFANASGSLLYSLCSKHQDSFNTLNAIYGITFQNYPDEIFSEKYSALVRALMVLREANAEENQELALSSTLRHTTLNDLVQAFEAEMAKAQRKKIEVLPDGGISSSFTGHLLGGLRTRMKERRERKEEK